MEFFTKLSDRTAEQITGGTKPDNSGQEVKDNLRFLKIIAKSREISLRESIQQLSGGAVKNIGQAVSMDNPASDNGDI